MARRRSKRGKLKGRLDIIKADLGHDVVWVKTKKGYVSEIAIKPRGHYVTRARLKPRRRKRKSRKGGSGGEEKKG